ncbi:MAG: hypothetical protein ACM3UZ_12265 [Acidobacteriota bacterium]
MKHILRISVSKEPKDGGVVGCRNVTIREKLIRMLLGDNRRLTVIVTGDSVKALSIIEEGDEQLEQSQVAAGCSSKSE